MWLIHDRQPSHRYCEAQQDDGRGDVVVEGLAHLPRKRGAESAELVHLRPGCDRLNRSPNTLGEEKERKSGV